MQNSNIDEKNRVTDRANLKHKKKTKKLKNIDLRIASVHSVHIKQNLIALKHVIQFLYIVFTINIKLLYNKCIFIINSIYIGHFYEICIP